MIRTVRALLPVDLRSAAGGVSPWVVLAILVALLPVLQVLTSFAFERAPQVRTEIAVDLLFLGPALFLLAAALRLELRHPPPYRAPLLARATRPSGLAASRILALLLLTLPPAFILAILFPLLLGPDPSHLLGSPSPPLPILWLLHAALFAVSTVCAFAWLPTRLAPFVLLSLLLVGQLGPLLQRIVPPAPRAWLELALLVFPNLGLLHPLIRAASGFEPPPLLDPILYSTAWIALLFPLAAIGLRRTSR